MSRPYKVKHYKFVGIMACIMSGFMVACYLIPGTGATLGLQEWLMAGSWVALGGVFYIHSKMKYGEKFGSLIEIISDSDAATLQEPTEELDEKLDLAIEAAIASVLNDKAVKL